MIPGRTKLLMLESPTNPRMQVCDIAPLCAAAHEAGALAVVDNSIMAFLYQRPLDLGADISMTSATKFVGGHSDVMAGLLSVKDEALAKRVYFYQAGPALPAHKDACCRGGPALHSSVTLSSVLQ